jgi:hypothetical protein
MSGAAAPALYQAMTAGEKNWPLAEKIPSAN